VVKIEKTGAVAGDFYGDEKSAETPNAADSDSSAKSFSTQFVVHKSHCSGEVLSGYCALLLTASVLQCSIER